MPPDFISSVRVLATALVMLTLGLTTLAQSGVAQAPRRAKPPTFKGSSTADIFYDNVFDHVQGERPQSSALQASIADPSTAAPRAPADSIPADTFAWSRLISASALEDEVKALKMKVDEAVTTPGKFQAQGHKLARNHFANLATLFAIVHQYDGQVRWKEESATARDLFAHSAANSKSGSIQVFNEAKQRKQDLQDLLNGARLVAASSASTTQWAVVAERAPLMRRLESGFQGIMTPAVGSQQEFAANKTQLLHEAQLIAALAEVLTQEGMMDADDDTYADFARQMQAAALNVVQGVQQGNYEQVRSGVGQINQSCSQCHELYRG